jgi:hypothetical protein
MGVFFKVESDSPLLVPPVAGPPQPTAAHYVQQATTSGYVLTLTLAYLLPSRSNQLLPFLLLVGSILFLFGGIDQTFVGVTSTKK